MSDEQILKELEYLRNKVASQQEHIDALGAMVDKKVSAKVEEEVKKSGGGKVALANKFIDQLTLKGDLRARYEIRDKDYKEGQGSDISRDRWRTRFRVGGVWDNKAENWQVGAGLASGSNDPTSTNDTWSEDKPFETGDIRLDYAYAKHKWDDFAFTIGQHVNPYKSSWVLWDGDVRLAGLTAQYGAKQGIFATLGGYSAKLVNDDNTATLVAGQAGYNGKAGAASYTLAAGYHTYSKSLINGRPGQALPLRPDLAELRRRRQHRPEPGRQQLHPETRGCRHGLGVRGRRQIRRLQAGLCLLGG
jgi:hypothetical protein